MLDTLPRRRRWPAVALVLAALGACRPAPEETPTPGADADADAVVAYDLLRQLPAAVNRHQVAKIDLGTPAARSHLLDGWGEDEEDAEGPFLWSLGEGAELEFYVAAPADLTLVLHCRKLVFDGAPPQIVSLALNGSPVGEAEIGPVFELHRVEVPAAALRPGMNRLGFGHGYHRPPAEVIAGSQDRRPLAVQWTSIAFEGLAEAAAPRRAGDDPDADHLELPVHSEVAYHLKTQPGDELVVGDLISRGNGAGAALRARFETADGTADMAIELGGETRPIRWRLPVSRPGLARLTLAAVDKAGRGKAQALSLLLPVVMREAEAAAGDRDAAATATAPQTSRRRPPILIYLIDALRADHLGVYGYHRPTSPHLDRFAGDGIVFTNAQAQSSWTRTAVASLFTGLLPQVHGVNDREDALAQPIHTLAEILAAAGFHCRGVITNGNVSATFGLGQGFERYRHLGESKRQISIHQLSHRINQTLFEWFDSGELPGEEPFFLYLHTTDPHAPYTPPEAFRKRFANGVDPGVGRNDHVRAITLGHQPAPAGTRQDWIDLYDGEIAFNDHQFGLLIDKLKTLDLYDSALIVVLSDHGEEFFDHGGWQHGRTLYGEQLRVPLIVKLPGNQAAGTRVDAIADQIDVLPTILDYLGIEPPSAFDGRSLLPLLDGGDRERPSYSYLALGDKRVRGVLADGWKLIVDESDGLRRPARELFRVRDDPAETRDRYLADVIPAGFLHQTLRGLEAGLRGRSEQFTPERAEMSEQLRERLEALGYLQ